MNLPSWLPLWAFIVIVVVVSLFLLFILSFVITSIFYHAFSKRLKKDSIAIDLLMHQRYELMIEFMKVLDAHKIEVNEEDKRAINRLERISDFQLLLKQDRDERVLAFVHSSHNIITLCETHETVVKDPVYTDLLLQFNDVEETYRQKSALYNSNVLGYNYWVNIPVVKIFFRMAKKRPKDLIV